MNQKLKKVEIRLPPELLKEIDALTSPGPIPELANTRAAVIRVCITRGLAATRKNIRRRQADARKRTKAKKSSAARAKKATRRRR